MSAVQTIFLRKGSKREQRTRHDHLKTMEDVLQFQIDHEGNLPKQRGSRQENHLRKRYDRVKTCGKCGALERMRLQWSEAHASPVGKYLLARVVHKRSSFLSNAARNYQAVMKHLKDKERKIQELYDHGEDYATFRWDDIYWGEDVDAELDHPLFRFLNSSN